MSGSGRKTTYRKGVTKRVLYGDPEPKANEQVVRVVALRGSNLFEVVSAEGDKSVTMLPTKFRKLIWVKRGDFLIVAEGDGEATVATGKKGAVTSIVEHILYKDQIRNLKSKNLWPAAFDQQRPGEGDDKVEEKAEDEKATEGKADEDKAEDGEASAAPAASDNGIKMLDMFADMHMNRNRRKGHFAEDDEAEDADSDDE